MLIRRTITFIKRKHRESVIHVMLLFLLFSFFFSGVVMYQSTAKYRDEALAEIGATLQVSHLPEIDESELVGVDKSIISSVESIPHVLGVDVAPPSLSGSCIPLNFETVKEHTGCDPEQQLSTLFSAEEAQLESDCVELIGCSAIPLRNQFRNNLSVISEGAFPTNDNPGILISRYFAELNSLRINDVIELKYLYSDHNALPTQVKIVGIYDTSLKFEVLEDNDMGVAVYKASPYNAVFTDFDTASIILGHDNIVYNFKVYVDSPQYLEAVQEDIQKLPLDWSNYRIYNETLSFYNEYASQIDTIFSNSLRLIILTSTVGVILFFVVHSIWNKQRIRDIGILEVLGEKRSRIFALYTIETLILSFVATIISIPISYLLMQFISQTYSPEFVSSNIINIRTPFDSGEYEVNPVYSVSFDIKSVLFLMIFVLLIVGITGITLLFLMRKSCKLQEMLKSEG